MRELRNVVTRPANFAAGGVSQRENLGLPLRGAPPSRDLPDGVERRTTRRLLRDTNGHRQRAAELLGISRRTLSRKLKLCRIESAEGVEACPGASAAERWSDDIRLPGKTA